MSAVLAFFKGLLRVLKEQASTHESEGGNEGQSFCQEPTLGVKTLIQKHSHDLFASLRSHLLKLSQCQLYLNRSFWGVHRGTANSLPGSDPLTDTSLDNSPVTWWFSSSDPQRHATQVFVNLVHSPENAFPMGHMTDFSFFGSQLQFSLQYYWPHYLRWHPFHLPKSFFFFNFSTLFPYGYSLISDSWLLITCTTFAITRNYLTYLLCLFLHIPFSYSHPLFSSPTSFFSSLFPRVDWKLCGVDENLCFKYMHTIKVY